MSLLNIILILLYLIWSYRVVFKLNWGNYDSLTETTSWSVITAIILLALIRVLIMHGYLEFLTKPLW